MEKRNIHNSKKFFTPVERLDYITKNEKITYNKLGGEIGLSSSQLLYDIRSGKVKDISADVADKINKRYPKYDLGWLISGYGTPEIDEKYYTQKERIETLLKEENLTAEQLAQEVNVEVSIINKILEGKEEGMTLPFADELIKAFPNYDPTWLKLGGYTYLIDYLDELHPEKLLQLFEPKTPERIEENQSINLYDITAAANLQSLFNQKDQNILGQICIPDMPKCDGAIYVTGDSMYPILKSGDIVMYKEINDLASIIYGEMYLISFNLNGDEYLAVKYVNRSELKDHVRLVSYNDHYAPMDIPLSSIRALALVKMSIRKNTMM